MQYRFSAYKLEFLSDYEPPALQTTSDSFIFPDVVISTGCCPEKLVDAAVTTDYFQVSSNDLLLDITNIARYHIAHGNLITVEPYPDADFDKVRLFLFGSALGALLYQRGLFPIHGCAVKTAYGAMIFVGAQGAGKSTLAAHYQLKGYKLLSDDVCAVTKGEDGRLLVLPAFSQLRLCDDAFKRFCTENTYPSARYDVDKFVVPLVSGYYSEPSPLCAIHLLSDNELEQITFSRMSGFDRFNLIISNLYRPSYLNGLASKEGIMRLASRIASESEIIEIHRPRDTSRIDELIGELEKEWLQNKIYHKKEKAFPSHGTVW